MIAILLLAIVPIVMWSVQSVLLRAAGLPLRWRIDSREAPAHIRAAGRLTTQLCLVVVICAYPLVRGAAMTGYYKNLFPPSRFIELVNGLAASVLCLCLLFLAWIATGRVQVLLHHSRRKWIRRMLLLVPTALLGAFGEELLFRGVIMADLGRSGQQTRLVALQSGLLTRPTTGRFVVVAVSALIFASAHYIRAVKRRWTFPGHVVLGCLLGLAFLRSGSLWLPIGLHAGGIFMIMGTRPFFRYRGPAWLTGASIFPFAGGVGVAGLLVLTAFVLRYNSTP